MDLYVFGRGNLPETVILMNSQNRHPSDNTTWNSRNTGRDQSVVPIHFTFFVYYEFGVLGGLVFVWFWWGFFFFLLSFFLSSNFTALQEKKSIDPLRLRIWCT